MSGKPIELRAAWAPGTRRVHKVRPTCPHSHVWIHRLNSGITMHHVADDVLIVHDGDGGYIPLSISGLRALITEVKRQTVNPNPTLV